MRDDVNLRMRSTETELKNVMKKQKKAEERRNQVLEERKRIA
jgi:hypothetical protein